MKKIYTLALLAMAAIPAGAEGILLNGFTSTDNIERCVYIYNEMNKVAEIRKFDTRLPHLNMVYKITYDEAGNEIRNDWYQDMNETGSEDYNDFVHTAYIEYEYNAKGKVIKRQNYNNWGASTGNNEWERGGIVTYKYDGEGKLISEKTYFDENDLFQDRKYYYNENGTVKRIEASRKDAASGEMLLSDKIEYLYNDAGLLWREEDYIMDTVSGYFIPTAADDYSYDEEGNLLEVSAISTNGVQGKTVMNYDTESPVPASDMIFPYENEEKVNNQLFSLWRTMPVSCDSYGIDDSTGELALIISYTYDYEKPVVGVSLNSLSNMRGPVGVLSFNGSSLVLTGVQTGTPIRIYDTNGIQAEQTLYNGELDLSGLSRGTYIVVTPTSAVKIKK